MPITEAGLRQWLLDEIKKDTEAVKTHDQYGEFEAASVRRGRIDGYLRVGEHFGVIDPNAPEVESILHPHKR
jgi:hypothetical protein